MIFEMKLFRVAKYYYRFINLKFKNLKLLNNLRATPREELSMLCILYLAILLEKRESNRFAKIASHLFRSSSMVNIACMSR